MTWFRRLRLPRPSSLLEHAAWKWLYFGLGVKRWLVLLFIGITLLSLGAAYVLIAVYREQSFPEVFYYLTLQFIPRPIRALLFGTGGVALVILSVLKLNQSLLSALAPRQTNLVETLYRRRQRQRALKIVAIGGGTGLSTLLRGLKNYTENLTAIVTVADDGGSSGRLREELGLLPPGDFRQCIAALADAEPLMTRLFEYRFGQGSGLDGHSFGNLFIAAMAGITGNFESALSESSRVLAVRGEILPSTLQNVILCAEVRGTNQRQVAGVRGESQIAKFGLPVERAYLEPEHVPAYPAAVRAILEADLIIAGPGSLFTSVIPNLLVEDIRNVLRASAAEKIYVCNVATEHGETDSYSLQDHIDALEAHTQGALFTTILANDNWRGQLPPHAQIEFVTPRSSKGVQLNAPTREFVYANVVDDQFPWRHDPEKLAHEILRWHAQKKKNRKHAGKLSDSSQHLEEKWQHA
jgi:uncharacterized cofD-like protein